MRRYRDPVDPHLDPMRAPSRKGQHPHLIRSQDEVKNPQQMYEQRARNSLEYQQMRSVQQQALGGARQQQQAPQQGLLDNPLVVFGLGALAAWALVQLSKNNGEKEVRKNPAPAPSAPAVVVMPPALPPAAAPVIAPSHPTPISVTVPAAKTETTVVTIPVEKCAKPAKAEAKTQQKVVKKRRTRKTTQKRDKKGHYLPAGTRNRAIVEGKEKKK